MTSSTTSTVHPLRRARRAKAKAKAAAQAQTATTTGQAQTTRTADYKDVKGSPGLIDWIANAVVHVVTFPILFSAKIINPFVERGGAGVAALGAVAFLAGVIAGADNYYQLFTGKALLPWFITNDWVGDLAVQSNNPVTRWLTGLWGGQTIVGWGAVLFTIFSLIFLIALAFSLLTQFVQGQAVRGRSLASAQSEFQHWNAATMPAQPDADKKLDMATVSWKQLKRTGKSHRSFMGFIAIAVWMFEFIAAFTAHNPLNYTGQAGLFIGCTLYALVTVGAGEIGYNIYVSALDESK